MKEYLHKKVIDLPMYTGKLAFILSNSSKLIKRYIPEFEDEIPYACTWYSPLRNRKAFIIVLNFEYTPDKVNHGVIAHEVNHAANMIAEDHGFTPDFNNDEPMAYLVGYITNQLYKFIKKHKKNVSI